MACLDASAGAEMPFGTGLPGGFVAGTGSFLAKKKIFSWLEWAGDALGFSPGSV